MRRDENGVQDTGNIVVPLGMMNLPWLLVGNHTSETKYNSRRSSDIILRSAQIASVDVVRLHAP